MNQHSDPGFEPRVADWLEDGPTQAPRDVMATVRAALPSVKQRRALAPWRHPVMSQLTKLAAAAAIVVAVGAGAYLLGSNAPNASPGPAAANAMATYREARDAVCTAAAAEVEPLRTAFGLPWAPNASREDVDAGIAALKAYLQVTVPMLLDLRAIAAPAEVAEDHITANARYDDLVILIRQMIVRLEAQEFDEALGIDTATNPIGRQIELFELEYDLVSCP